MHEPPAFHISAWSMWGLNRLHHVTPKKSSAWVKKKNCEWIEWMSKQRDGNAIHYQPQMIAESFRKRAVFGFSGARLNRRLWRKLFQHGFSKLAIIWVAVVRRVKQIPSELYSSRQATRLADIVVSDPVNNLICCGMSGSGCFSLETWDLPRRVDFLHSNLFNLPWSWPRWIIERNSRTQWTAMRQNLRDREVTEMDGASRLSRSAKLARDETKC